MIAELAGGAEARLRLVPGVYSVLGDDGRLWLVSGDRNTVFGASDGWKRELTRRLAAERMPVSAVFALAREHGGGEADIAEFVDRLLSDGWLMTTVGTAGRPLYTVQPFQPPPERKAPLETGGSELSRFAVMHREHGRMVIESPLSWGRMVVHDPEVLALVGRLGCRPSGSGSGSEEAEDAADPDVPERLLDDLRWLGLSVPAQGSEENELGLRQWSPHELWFHRRTRTGGPTHLGRGYGRTQWAKGTFAPLPARSGAFTGPGVDLRRLDLAEVADRDRPLQAVMEERRSVRAHDDDRPLTVDQLGELLHRTAADRGSFEADQVEYRSKPYPSGGSAYELEIYPVVRLVSGLAAGMYHYDGAEHRLRLVRPPDTRSARLLANAARAAGATAPPQVLLVITARFGRLMWAYEEMPYALILKHVGVLYQTLYLAATAMGLAPCALGGGSATAFTELTGLDYTVESAVGEFMLGSHFGSRATDGGG